MQTQTTAEELTQALNTIKTVAQVIQTANEIPSGHLYAMLMGKMNLETYQRIIKVLKDSTLVKEENFLLIWNGPAEIPERANIDRDTMEAQHGA